MRSLPAGMSAFISELRITPGAAARKRELEILVPTGFDWEASLALEVLHNNGADPQQLLLQRPRVRLSELKSQGLVISSNQLASPNYAWRALVVDVEFINYPFNGNNRRSLLEATPPPVAVLGLALVSSCFDPYEVPSVTDFVCVQGSDGPAGPLVAGEGTAQGELIVCERVGRLVIGLEEWLAVVKNAGAPHAHAGCSCAQSARAPAGGRLRCSFCPAPACAPNLVAPLLPQAPRAAASCRSPCRRRPPPRALWCPTWVRATRPGASWPTAGDP